MLEPSPLPSEPQDDDAQRRLEREHELDLAPLGGVPSEDPDPRAERLDSPQADPDAPPAPTMARRTRLLLLALLGTVCFLAGIQVQKLAGGGNESAAPTSGTGDAAPANGGSPAAQASGAVRGEILTVDDATLYLRGAGGRTFSLHTGPATRLSGGRFIHRGDLRPGESVIADAQRRPDGRLLATSITVLRPPRVGEP